MVNPATHYCSILESAHSIQYLPAVLVALPRRNRQSRGTLFRQTKQPMTENAHQGTYQAAEDNLDQLILPRCDDFEVVKVSDGGVEGIYSMRLEHGVSPIDKQIKSDVKSPQDESRIGIYHTLCDERGKA
jgi:hypothetical protein